MSLRIGIACYATFGGSGIIATEVGVAMARRGHCVHFICTDVPRRLHHGIDHVFFHQVQAQDYPVFPRAPYSLALTSKMVSVATHEGLDVLHAHYAVPHATSAWMAREMLGSQAPRVVTTLHGTDITLVGMDEGYLPVTRHSIVQSDAVTAPSAFLRDDTYARFDIDRRNTAIDVIPNFVDCDAYRPAKSDARPRLEALFGSDVRDVPVLVHVSNFREVKRVDWVVEIFARACRKTPCFLLLIGDGPERPRVEAALRRLGVAERSRLLGNQEHVAPLIRECAVFLLPSSTESFGLAALEALASGVPVVASRVGGLPEVVQDGETGLLVDPGDLDGMVDAVTQLLEDPSGRRRMAEQARTDVVERFRRDPLIDRYEALYRRLVAGG